MTYGVVISWGLTLVLAGAVVLVYKPDLINKAFPSARDSAGPESTNILPRASGKKSKPKGPQAKSSPLEDGGSSIPTGSTGAKANKKRKIAASAAEGGAATAAVAQRTELPRVQEDNLNDKEFAQQLAKAQTGTQLQSSSQPKPSKKERRAAAAGTKTQGEAAPPLTDTSSNAGADADDDMSPAESPAQQPRLQASRAGDVSDMLEAGPTKATSIRIVNVPGETKKASAQKPFEPVVSKKKRNEQARREEQKRAVEESNKIHEAKKQEQLRRARTAEGSSNQVKANAFAKTANAWQNGSKPVVKAPPSTTTGPLLDTFDPSASAAPTNGSIQSGPASDFSEPAIENANTLRERVGENRITALAASNRERIARPGLNTKPSWADEMTEEAQLERLREQDQEDAWESVTNKKVKRKNKTETDTSSEASFTNVRPTTAASKTVTPPKKTNQTVRQADPTNRFSSIQMNGKAGLQDDEWQA